MKVFKDDIIVRTSSLRYYLFHPSTGQAAEGDDYPQAEKALRAKIAETAAIMNEVSFDNDYMPSDGSKKTKGKLLETTLPFLVKSVAVFVLFVSFTMVTLQELDTRFAPKISQLINGLPRTAITIVQKEVLRLSSMDEKMRESAREELREIYKVLKPFVDDYSAAFETAE